MDALNIHTIQANLKRLTPMQLQMEAQSQVVPQWLVALEQQRRSTLQEGLASMQAPQQQTTVMEDLAAKTASPEPMSQPEGIAQYAEGGVVGKKNRWDSLLENFNGSSDAFVVQSAPSTMEQMQEAGAPKSYINKLQSLWDEAQKRLDKPREYQLPAPTETTVETLGKTDNDTQPVGIEAAQGENMFGNRAMAGDEALTTTGKYSDLADLEYFAGISPENRTEAVTNALKYAKEDGRHPAYIGTLETLLAQSGKPAAQQASQPEQGIPQALPQPLPMKEETLADAVTPPPTLTPNGQADNAPVQSKFLSPEEMEATLSTAPKVTPNLVPTANKAWYDATMADIAATEKMLDGHSRQLDEMGKQQPIPQAPMPQAPQPEQGIPQALPPMPQAAPAPKKPEVQVPPDVKPYWDLIKQGGDMPKPNLDGYDKKSERKEKQLKYAEDNNLSMALMSASAAILAGESPFTMVNLGRGFAAGLHQYANGRKNINDLQDQIDDVTMARDKAANDQNMREFELQDRRLSVLATIKQRMDEAAAKNATHLEGARIAAGASRYSADRNAASQDRYYQQAALTAWGQAQQNYTHALDLIRKAEADDAADYTLTDKQKTERRLARKNELNTYIGALQFAKDTAAAAKMNTSSMVIPSPLQIETGARVVGDSTNKAQSKATPKTTTPPKPDERLEWGRPGGQIEDPQIKINRERAGG